MIAKNTNIFKPETTKIADFFAIVKKWDIIKIVDCGHGSMAEQVLPKHLIRVRFSLSALFLFLKLLFRRFTGTFDTVCAGLVCHGHLTLLTHKVLHVPLPGSEQILFFMIL